MSEMDKGPGASSGIGATTSPDASASGTSPKTPDTTAVVASAPEASSKSSGVKESPTFSSRRDEIMHQLATTGLTTEQRVNLMKESDDLLIAEVTNNVTASVTKSVTRAMNKGMKKVTDALTDEITTLNKGLKKTKTEMNTQVTSLTEQVSLQQQQILAYEAQRKAQEEKAEKDKRSRLIKLVAGAIGFTTAMVTPVGFGVIALAGVAGMGLKFLANKGNEKLQQYASQIESHASRIRRLRDAMSGLKANDPNRVIAEEAILGNVESAERIENKRKWVSRLTGAATFLSPALQGFAIGAGLGGVTRYAIDTAVNSAVAAKTAGASEAVNAATPGTGGTGVESATRIPGTSGMETTSATTLDLPGSAYHGTTLQHHAPADMHPGGMDNPSNYFGSTEGMAAYKFRAGAEATGLSDQVLFSGDNGAFTANAHQVINTLKANPSLDFASAYEQVMGDSLQSIIQSSTTASGGVGGVTLGN